VRLPNLDTSSVGMNTRFNGRTEDVKESCKSPKLVGSICNLTIVQEIASDGTPLSEA